MNESHDDLQEIIDAAFWESVAVEGDGLIADFMNPIFNLISLALSSRVSNERNLNGLAGYIRSGVTAVRSGYILCGSRGISNGLQRTQDERLCARNNFRR